MEEDAWITSVFPRLTRQGICLLLLLLHMCCSVVLRCGSHLHCPEGGYCFQDECARCLCAKGMYALDYLHDNKPAKMCLQRPNLTPKVGDTCDYGYGSRCPHGSDCDLDTQTCLCHPGLLPHHDYSHCRQGVYGEGCNSTHACADSLGYACHDGTCDCAEAYHRPTAWTRFVLTRWDYKMVAERPQECVARAVGEPCHRHAECAAIQGTGGRCGACGFCQCRKRNHVPDALGTKCGPAQSLREPCSLHGRHVCDGTQGLQCGDTCDLYSYDVTQPKHCACSQMHVQQGDTCVTKTMGSPCTTDLDCFPLSPGFGYCDGGECNVFKDGPLAEIHQPYLVNRKCDKERPKVKEKSLSQNKGRLEGTKMAADSHNASHYGDTYSTNVSITVAPKGDYLIEARSADSASGVTMTVHFCGLVLRTVLWQFFMFQTD